MGDPDTDALDFNAALIRFHNQGINPFSWRGDTYKILANGDVEKLLPPYEPLMANRYRGSDPLDLENCYALAYQNQQNDMIERLRDALRRITTTPITSDCQRIAREALGE